MTTTSMVETVPAALTPAAATAAPAPAKTAQQQPQKQQRRWRQQAQKYARLSHTFASAIDTYGFPA